MGQGDGTRHLGARTKWQEMLPAAQQWGVEILILLLFLLAEILTGQIVVCIGKLLSILGFH